MTISCKRAVPILRMFDEAMTKQFYVDFLGFEIMFEHRFDDSAPLYMGIKKGDCELHLSGHFGDGTPGVAIRIETTDLDDYMALLRSKNYRHARPGCPEAQEWGAKEITIQDPASNQLRFYENLPRT